MRSSCTSADSALVEGLFDRNCVKVNVVNNNAVAVQGALLVGGQTDLIVSASSGPAAIRVQGQPVKTIMSLTASFSGNVAPSEK